MRVRVQLHAPRTGIIVQTDNGISARTATIFQTKETTNISRYLLAVCDEDTATSLLLRNFGFLREFWFLLCSVISRYTMLIRIIKDNDNNNDPEFR